MDKSMMTGSYLLEVLNDQTILTDVLGNDKIFPLVAKEDTTYPFVVYTRDSVQIQYTKQLNHDNLVTLTYRVYSDNYDQGVEIANIIRNLLEHKQLVVENEIKINEIRVAGMYETFSDNGFCQQISFQMYVE